MAKPKQIELGHEISIPILYEDRSVLAIDKPPGWMLVPYNWDKTDRNLQLAISSSILAGDFWARSRNLKFLKYVHRLDAETTGVLLFAKSAGAVRTYGDLFESRLMEKRYLAVVRGKPHRKDWTCSLAIGPDPGTFGRMRIDPKNGKPAETSFRVLAEKGGLSLIDARPFTGRTHQIRLHLADHGTPVTGDNLYGTPEDRGPRRKEMGLRAIDLRYRDPFLRRTITISAPPQAFLEQYGFDPTSCSRF